MSAGTGREPLYDVHPRTGAAMEVFYADRTLENGRGGAGWFWWSRRRGFSPECSATGPFPTSYAAYRDAVNGGELRASRPHQFGKDTRQFNRSD